MLLSYILVGLVSGFLFGLMDALINANPLAVRLLAVYKPLARASIPMPLAVAADVVYGFLMAGIFVLLYNSLPGGAVLKGLSFGLLAWFFRVAMNAVSQWVMFSVPARTVLYNAAAGLLEMLVLGLFYGLTLPLAS